MAKSLTQLAHEVILEVGRAREQWGADFDEKNTLNDWVTYIGIYTGKAAEMRAPKEDVEKNLRKAAGLVLSALYHATNDLLAPRHYDAQPRPASLPDINVQ